MCHETEPSRRAFTSLLAAGAAIAALAACSPSPVTPSPVAAPPGTPDPALVPTLSSAGAATDTSPVPMPQAGGGGTATAETARHPFMSLPQQHSLTDPASPWVIVNKHRPLTPLEFIPADLVQPNVLLAVSGEAALLNSTTAAAAERMFAAAAGNGVALALASGYRSFATQAATYNGYVGTRGQASADTASARPGYSEHQTGWAFDIADGSGACSFLPCFAEQPAAAWAKANAHSYGFVVRYPWMHHDTTGYYYESWHLRYVGVEAASDMVAKGIPTLEEYFGLAAAPGYL